MTPAVVIAILLSVAGGAAQNAGSEIAGRITDKDGGSIPGARVRIAAGGETRPAITDRDGRFVVSSLPLATYRVVVELAGFLTLSGDITLSTETRRAYLDWKMDVGCIENHQIVLFKAREAARIADAIVHLRVVTADGAVRISKQAGCQGYVRDEYSVDVLRRVPAPPASSDDNRRLQILAHPRLDAALTPGAEYLTLLWANRDVVARLVMPIVDGRISAPSETELNGLPVEKALGLLERWSRERR